MRGFRVLSLALILCGALSPLTVSAQEDTDATQEAEKQMALAMLQSDPTARMPLYQAALAALEPAFTADANNALVWKIAGDAYVGLHRFAEAADAFERAEQLYPEYAEEIEAQREAGWIAGFNQGVQQMNEGQTAEAAASFEAANALYDKRPEAYMNLANMYATQNDTEGAIRALQSAIDASQSDLFERLDTETQQQWLGMREAARTSLPQLEGAMGVEAFNAQDYETAHEWFMRALASNPHSRDYAYNVLQARWVQADAFDRQSRAEGATPDAQTTARLVEMFEGVVEAVPLVREKDPNNETVLAILAQARRRIGHVQGDSAGGDQAAFAVVEQIDALPVTIDQIAMTGEENAAGELSYTIEGILKNRKLEQGTSVTIDFTLLGIDGNEVGAGAVQVAAPSPETMTEGCASDPAPCSTAFSGVVTVNGDVAGWRYEVQG